MAVHKKFKYALLALFATSVLSGCGLDGDDGAPGEKGEQGEQGTTGAGGQNGSNGADASLGVSLSLVGRASLNGVGSAEVVQYHAASQTIYAANSANNSVSMINASGLTSTEMNNPVSSVNLTSSSISLPAQANGVAIGKVNSIAVFGDLLAVAVPAAAHGANGFVLFYNGLNASAPVLLDAVEVGADPDMLTFTPDGGKVLVANEGEPNGDYSVDPEGSVSVIDILLSGKPEEVADTVLFTSLNGTQAKLTAQGMQFPNPTGSTINGNAIDISVAQDLEPEYIVASNTTAYVTLQENNGLAIVDLEELSVEVIGLGSKDWTGLNLDAKDDGAVSFAKYPGLRGVYMPDAIASFEWKDATFLVTANEGDAREYFFDVADQAACTAAGGAAYDAENGCLSYTDEVALKDLTAAAGSPLESLQATGEIDDLRVTKAMGDADGDGEYSEAYAYGARSFTIWDQNGLVVFDSGDDFERITASIHGAQFNNDARVNRGDSRSSSKGPEPEALTLGTVGSRTYAFIGFERMGGIMVYDVTNPYDAFFVDYVINRNLTKGMQAADVIGDLAPETMLFVSADNSATDKPLLVVGNEASGTVAVWEITPK